MTKAIGAALIVAAFTMAGQLRCRDLRRRARLISALVASLELMRGEISDYLAPLPETAERLARTGPEETRGFYALLSIRLSELGEMEFSEIWSECVSRLELPETDAETLRDLGRTIGRYGVAEQEAAFTRCIERLGAVAETAAEQAVSGGKLYTSLGVTVGLLLAVVLI